MVYNFLAEWQIDILHASVAWKICQWVVVPNCGKREKSRRFWSRVEISGGSSNGVSPGRHDCFNTRSWSNGLDEWRYSHDFGNLCFSVVHWANISHPYVGMDISWTIPNMRSMALPKTCGLKSKIRLSWWIMVLCFPFLASFLVFVGAWCRLLRGHCPKIGRSWRFAWTKRKETSTPSRRICRKRLETWAYHRGFTENIRERLVYNQQNWWRTVQSKQDQAHCRILDQYRNLNFLMAYTMHSLLLALPH